MFGSRRAPREPMIIAHVRAFLLGLWEFRTDWTTHFDYPLIESYDFGRELAHRATFRHYDRNY